ncbi:hypothetical protein KFL_007070060, partial [Klebsormidium nitens]
STTRG